MNSVLKIALVFCILIQGCSTIQSAHFYKPASMLEEAKSVEWGDGVAVSRDNICIWVADGSASYIPMTYGPIGIPVFPLGVISAQHHESNKFILNLWLVPEVGYKNFTFDPRQVTLKFDSGLTNSADLIQVSRFSTIWVKENVYMFTPDTIEKIERSNHSEYFRPSSFIEPIKLHDWTRVFLVFDKDSIDVMPVELLISGVYKDGNNMQFKFKLSKEKISRILVSGQTAKGELMGDSPAVPCRQLQIVKEKTE